MKDQVINYEADWCPDCRRTKDFVIKNQHVRTKGLNQTNVPGTLAAGDVRNDAIAQVAAATSEGVLASYGLRAHLKSGV